jgi:hypothetical protein
VRFFKSPRVAGVAAVLCTALIPAVAHADSGGIGTGSGTGTQETVPGSQAKLVNGKAIAPANAPEEVQEVIAAANRIRNKPYVYGGGHGSFKDDGYDCSGSVSYALHGGHFLKTPLDSTGLGKWGDPGKGGWITVYGAPSHAYMVVAGLRFDTSMTPGDGPSWSKAMRSTPETYRVRHPEGF